MARRAPRIAAPVTDDRSPAEIFNDAVHVARKAFNDRAVALGDPRHEGIAADAFANAFSVETHDEYRDDLERWAVALATLNMIADEAEGAMAAAEMPLDC